MAKEDGADLGRAKWQADMARGSRLDRIHSEATGLGCGLRKNFSV
jgi:hypothetical protein